MKRKDFLNIAGLASIGIATTGLYACSNGTASEPTTEEVIEKAKALFFKISLAQWSFHTAIKAGEMDHLDFAATASRLGIGGVEYVSGFFKDKAKDMDYLNQMTQRATDSDVKQLLIMIDGEGGLGSLDADKLTSAVENHYKWVDAAVHIGCHSIRVNAHGVGEAADVSKAAIEGLGRLSEYAAKANLNVIVENHGGHSSNGDWMSNVLAQVNLPNCGSLPDFGNFCIEKKRVDGKRICLEDYDRYKGTKQLMPFAKAVSAKSRNFDADGNEVETDYLKMMKIVKDAGYTEYVGIEYEGKELSEEDGVIATKKLLEKVGAQLS
ncbi:MAG: TIM barrel protein [Flavobacteriales bacterium]|nr:TIM barrel protein [Flavobacteriales bacterium]